MNTGLSGLLAAQTRLGVSASNTSNALTDSAEVNGNRVNQPYQAQEVQEKSLADGGVQSVVMPVEPATIAVYDPARDIADENGIVNMPNVQQDSEAVQRILAKTAYVANLESIKAENANTESLLDILE